MLRGVSPARARRAASVMIAASAGTIVTPSAWYP
jgi:hypothetical protein